MGAIKFIQSSHHKLLLLYWVIRNSPIHMHERSPPYALAAGPCKLPESLTYVLETSTSTAWL